MQLIIMALAISEKRKKATKTRISSAPFSVGYFQYMKPSTMPGNTIISISQQSNPTYFSTHP
jgi:hypothetical protein